MVKKTVLCIALFALHLQGQAQHLYNLIPNGSFEQKKHCPRKWSSPNNQADWRAWFSPTNGTPDYFSACSPDKAGVPHNWAGTSYAGQGDSYAGMILGEKYREYLSVALKDTLRAGVEYDLSFLLKPSQHSGYTMASIDVAFTAQPVQVTHDHLLENIHYFTIEIKGKYAHSPQIWYTAQKKYLAKGKETYIIIGKFKEEKELSYTPWETKGGKNAMISNMAYFYFDAFSLTNPDHFPKVEYPSDSVFVMENVYFDFDKFALHQDAKEELDLMANFMIENQKYILLISGYTDQKGSKEYNTILSDRRAKSVKRYLLARGVPSNNIKTRAMGKAEKSDQHAQYERRVVFKLRIRK